MARIVTSCLLHLRRPLRNGLVFTRHGALGAARSMQSSRFMSPLTKLALVVVGSTLIGLGISLFIHARLGLPPYDVLLSSVADRSPLTHGQSGWAISGGLLILASVLGRRASRYGVLFIVVNGVSIDAWSQLVVDPSRLGVRILFVALGIVAVAAGIAVVAHSSSTGGPFELLTEAAADRSVNPTLFRSGLEFTTVGLGIALGGALGPATLAFVVLIGPTISMAVQALDDRRIGREQRLRPPTPVGLDRARS